LDDGLISTPIAIVGRFKVGRQQLSKELKEFIREQIHSVVMFEGFAATAS
jgi:hypothetical protein